MLSHPGRAPGMTGATLLGPDHTLLDHVAIVPVGTECAVGLSPGRHPKGYPHVDPNEDAVAAFSSGDRWIMAVADGHGGATAAVAAIRTIAANAASLLAGDPQDAARMAMTLAAHSAREVAGGTSDGPRSDTTLIVASISGGTAYLGCAGDSAAYVVTGRRVRRADAPAPFLGDPSAADLGVHRVAMSPRTSLVLASDGLTDFLGRRWRTAICTARAATPQATVATLIRTALQGGAGDNVAVALWQGGRRATRR